MEEEETLTTSGRDAAQKLPALINDEANKESGENSNNNFPAVWGMSVWSASGKWRWT